MKRILEVDDEEVVILLKPKKDSEGDWNHSTNIHFPKKHNDEYDVVSAISDLARAMVGFSYIASDELISLHTTFFDKAIDGKITGKEGDKLWNSIIDFELEEPVVERKGNVVHVDFTKEE